MKKPQAYSKDPVYTAPPVARTGKLFGNDLTTICEDGNLPKAILISRAGKKDQQLRALTVLLEDSSSIPSTPLASIYFVDFLIENYPKIFGEDISFHYGSSLLCSDGENTYNSLKTLTDNVEIEEKNTKTTPVPVGTHAPHPRHAVPGSSNFSSQ